MPEEIDGIVVTIRGDASDLESTINNVAGELSRLENIQRNNNAVTTTAERTVSSYGRQLQNTGKSMKELGEGIDTVTKPLQYTAAALAAGGVASAKFAIDFEDSFASVKKTVDGTPQQLDAIKQSIIDMSTVGINGHNAIPMTTDKLNELAAAGGQLGITVDNIADFTEVMAQMETATNLAGEEGAATMARFQNVMGISQSEIRNVGSAIVDLGNNSATTEAEIAAMALRMGKYGQTVGMGAADVLGYSAALSSLGIEAQLGGSAIGRTWLSIETAVANGGEELQTFAKYSGKSAKEFKEQWNTDSKGAFNGLLKGLQSAENLTLALDDLGINNTQDIQAMMALVNGYDLVTESVNRANTAYQENTALQEEFNSKSETTASQLAVTKNNIVEAARSIGETMLPTIKDVSGGVAEFAQKLASMDDGAKKFLIGTGATLIGLGAASKGLASSIKTAGEIKEAYGKLKDNKALQSFVTTLSAIPLPAKLAVAGIAAVSVAGIAAYNAYQKAQYEQAHFADGAKEASEALQKQKSALDEVNNYTWEFKDLQLKLNSDGISEEEKNSITARMQEIAKWFKENYEVELKVESGSVETAANNVDKLNNNLKHVTIDTEIKGNNTLSELIDGFENFKDAPTNRDAAVKQAEQWEADADRMLDAKMRVSDIAARVRLIQSDVLKNDGEKLNEIKKYEAQYQKVLKELYPDGGDDYNNLLSSFSHITESNPFDIRYKQMSEQAARFTAEAELAEEQFEKYQQSAKDYISQQNEMLSYDIGKGDDYSERIRKIGYAAQMAELPLGEVAAQTAAAQNGFKTFTDAAEQGGTALDNTVNNAIQNMQSWGANTDDIVRQAALMKNGFSDIEQALSKGDIAGVINDLGKLGGDMGMSVAQVDALAHSIGLIPEDKHIELTVNGYEIVEGASEKLKELDTENVHVFVSADGDLTVLNQATGETKNLQELGAVSLQVNADGNIDVLNQAGEKVAEIQDNPSATITVNTELEETTEDTTVTVDADAELAKEKISALNQEQVKVPVDANTDAADAKIKSLSQTVEVTAHYIATGDVPKGRAKGDMNFPGGLAMVNDERGISDNRELIVDRGRAFIPEGRDVILPLSRGAKVYTAAQTKAIMSGLGIPHYASGKNNSDAFTAEKDDWTHYKNTHAVTVTQELQKWVELSAKFTSNQKDVQDIQEQIFSLMQKQTKELNDQAKAYLEERSALNDWEDIGDSPLAAFGRVKDRNMEEVKAGRQTWDDYAKAMKDIGSDMYNARISQSKKWLDHEEKYNGMSVADALAGIDRMREYTQEYYEQGIISHREFIESKTELDEMYIDKYKEGLDEQHQASLAYIGERAYFNDWETVGDDPERAYNDTKARLDAALEEGRIQWEEYVKYKEELDNTLIDSTNDQSYAWLEEQRKYFGMSDEEYAAGLERVKKRNENWYANGIGTARKYHETISDLNHKRWDEASDAYDDMLKEQQDYINKMQEEFQKQEQALRDSWEVEDRRVDMATVQGQLDIYAGAVTDRGMQKYKELEEQMKQLQRDEELYQLQVKNTATIDALQADYETAENMKADYLKNIVTNTDINVSGIVSDLTSKIAGTGDNITNMLGQLLSAFQNFKVENNSMTDNRKFSYNISQMTPEQIQELCNALVGF